MAYGFVQAVVARHKIVTLVLNHQIMIWAVSRHWRVTISRRGRELRSLRLYISLTIESRFHMPSGSRPEYYVKQEFFLGPLAPLSVNCDANVKVASYGVGSLGARADLIVLNASCLYLLK